MRKIIQISFILLAGLFALKSIAPLATENYEICCETDLGENGSSKENNKEDIKEKDLLEDATLNYSGKLIIDHKHSIILDNYDEGLHFSPYFEVCSPPPELA